MDFLKIRIETLELGENINHLLSLAGIRTVGGLVEGTLFSIKEEILVAIPGMNIQKMEKIIAAVEKSRKQFFTKKELLRAARDLGLDVEGLLK